MRITSSQRKAALSRAQVAFNQGRLDEVAAIAESLLKHDRRDAEAMYLRISLALSQSRFSDAASDLRIALKRAPDHAALLVCDARIHQAHGRLEAAAQSLDRAIAASPNLIEAVHHKATVLIALGRANEAQALLAPHAESRDGDPQIVALAADLLVRSGDPERAEAMTRAKMRDQRIPPLMRRALFMSHGKSLDAQGRIEDAFASFREGNALVGDVYPKEAFETLHREIMLVFSRENLRAMPRAKSRSDRPIFIVGLPRSGSSLVENILAAHPDVHGGGELSLLGEMIDRMPTLTGRALPYPACASDMNEDAVERLAAAYLRRLRDVNRPARRVTDKMLSNYLNLGLIAVLFPGAPVVHCTRDPMDVGLSCYLNLSPQVQPWATSLEHIAHAIRLHNDLMDHWKHVLEARIHTTVYETLIAEPDGRIRALLESTGLAWDDACVRFHEQHRPVATFSFDQANQPVYRNAVRRHERYGELLDPLRRALAAQGVTAT